MLGPVSTGIGNHLWIGIPPRYITSHPHQLSMTELCSGNAILYSLFLQGIVITQMTGV